MPPPVKYVAELKNAREISLLGQASLPHWRTVLEKESLCPLESTGQAQILIVAAEGKFKSIRFREISFSILVEGGAYLLHACNSNGFFAWCERVFFSTPYVAAHITLNDRSIDVSESKHPLFSASLAPRGPSHHDDTAWDGRIFLPHKKYFQAHLTGLAAVFPFLPAADQFTLNPTHPLLRSLTDSSFTPTQWLLRPSANHFKSKTLHR